MLDDDNSPALFHIPEESKAEAVRLAKDMLRAEAKRLDDWIKSYKDKGQIVLKRMYINEDRIPVARFVDVSSLEVDGIHGWDAPDFSDAYFSAGSWDDGTKMSDDELNELQEEHPDLLQRMVNNATEGEK